MFINTGLSMRYFKISVNIIPVKFTGQINGKWLKQIEVVSNVERFVTLCVKNQVQLLLITTAKKVTNMVLICCPH